MRSFATFSLLLRTDVCIEITCALALVGNMSFVFLLVLFIGLFRLGPGLYTSCETIKADYSGAITPAFTCADTSIKHNELSRYWVSNFTNYTKFNL
jgi:hypothetical protein